MGHNEIWNRALVHLGHTGEEVTDYTTPETVAQEILAVVYNDAIELALGLYDWEFARRRSILTNVTATYAPSPEWDFSWLLPDDMIRFRGFAIERPRTKRDRIQYEMARASSDATKRIMMTREDPFQSTYPMIYTARITTETLFTKTFEISLAAALASVAAVPMTKSLEFADRMLALAQQYALKSEEVEADTEQEIRQVSSIELARS